MRFWLEVAARLAHHSDGALTDAIRAAMDGRQKGDMAAFPLTEDERVRVGAVLDSDG